MLNIQPQILLTAYLLQNLFQRQNCSFLLPWQEENITAISILTQTWVISDLPGPTQRLSDPPGWFLPFSPWAGINITLTQARWCHSFSPTSPHPVRDASELCKVTQVRATMAGMWGPHKPCWSCSMLDSHKLCRWYTHQVSLQEMWHEQSPVCAPEYQKHLLSFNKPWTSFIHHIHRAWMHFHNTL